MLTYADVLHLMTDRAVDSAATLYLVDASTTSFGFVRSSNVLTSP